MGAEKINLDELRKAREALNNELGIPNPEPYKKNKKKDKNKEEVSDSQSTEKKSDENASVDKVDSSESPKTDENTNIKETSEDSSKNKETENKEINKVETKIEDLSENIEVKALEEEQKEFDEYNDMLNTLLIDSVSGNSIEDLDEDSDDMYESLDLEALERELFDGEDIDEETSESLPKEEKTEKNDVVNKTENIEESSEPKKEKITENRDNSGNSELKINENAEKKVETTVKDVEKPQKTANNIEKSVIKTEKTELNAEEESEKNNEEKADLTESSKSNDDLKDEEIFQPINVDIAEKPVENPVEKPAENLTENPAEDVKEKQEEKVRENALPKIEDAKFINLIRSKSFMSSDNLTCIYGTDEENNVFCQNFKDFYNTIIFSENDDNIFNLFSSIIMSLLLKNSKYDVKFAICDAKSGGSFNVYNNLSYMFFDRVAESNREINEVLVEICHEIEERYRSLAKAGANSIEKFNADMKKAKIIPMPYLILFFNNYTRASHLDDSNEINNNLSYILRFGRLVGVYVNLVSFDENLADNINFNLQTRIAYQTELKESSISEIGEEGAEKIGYNDEFVLKTLYNEKIIHLKASKITQKEIELLIKNIEKK